MAGLAVDRQGPAKPASPSVVRIMNFTDPSHPKIAREFQGVTAITRDIRRRLIFLADSEGIWILREHLAEDPEIVQEYSDYVQYGLGGGFRAGHEAAVVGPHDKATQWRRAPERKPAALTAVKIARRERSSIPYFYGDCYLSEVRRLESIVGCEG
jgi:hypothetical protein